MKKIIKDRARVRVKRRQIRRPKLSRNKENHTPNTSELIEQDSFELEVSDADIIQQARLCLANKQTKKSHFHDAGFSVRTEER